MVEWVLIGLGALVLAYLFLVVRQWRLSPDLLPEDPPPVVVPVAVLESQEAVLMVEGRGRLVYVNDKARQWFGMNGDEPNLTLLAGQVKPSDALHDIITQEGRVSFRLGQRHIEASSHALPADPGQRMVIVLRELNPVQQDGHFDPIQAINTVGEISGLLTRSDNLQATLEAILQSIQTVIPFDLGEIYFWEEERTLLRPLSSYGKTQNGQSPKAEAIRKLDEGYSGWLARYRQPLLIDSTKPKHQSALPSPHGGYASFIGVPLTLGERFIGTLELASQREAAFDFQDLTLLQSFGGQVAVAIENSRLYRDQGNRQAELLGLQQIAQAMSDVSEPIAMFGQLSLSLAKLMDVGVCVLFLHEEGQLLAQRPAYGLADEMLPVLRLPVPKDSAAHQVWQTPNGWFANEPENERNVVTLGLADLVSKARLEAVCFAPMVVSRNTIGAVLVANPAEGGTFKANDAHALSVFASEAGLVVENARLYRLEKRRAAQLEGLQRIARNLETLREPEALYRQVCTAIADMMLVSVCGVWFYEPEEDVVRPQLSFYGVPDTQLTNLSIELAEHPPLALLWQQKSPWLTNNLDKHRADLPALATLMQTLGWRKGLWTLLQFRGTPLGFLQVGDKLDGTDFNDEDAALLETFARQVALLADSAAIYAQAERRAQIANELQSLAELLANAQRLEDIREDLFARIRRLLNCEFVAIGLLDSRAGRLIYSPDNSSDKRISQTIEFNTASVDFSRTVLVSRRPFVSNAVADDRRVLRGYQEVAQDLNLHNVILMPLVVRERGVGELLVANKRGKFTPDDEALVRTLAIQISGLLERISLLLETDSELRARLDDLSAQSRFLSQIVASLDAEQIAEAMRVEVRRSLSPESNVSLVLFSPQKNWPNDDSPQVQKRLGNISGHEQRLTLAEAKVWADGKGFCTVDYAQIGLSAIPVEARSALIEPITRGGQWYGLLHVYSTQSDAFKPRQRDFFAALCQQAALMLANARQYEARQAENQSLSGRLESLNQVYTIGQLVRGGLGLPEVLTELARALGESVNYRRVLVRVLDAESGTLEALARFGMSATSLRESRRQHYDLTKAQQLAQRRWRVAPEVYFLPSQYEAEWFKQGEATAEEALRQDRTWYLDDSLVAVLRDEAENILGLITLETPVSGQRPDSLVLETVAIFAREAAFSITSYRNLETLRAEASAIRQERDRLASLYAVYGKIQSAPDIPTRLQSIVEGIRAVGWGKVRLSLFEEGGGEILVHTGYSEEEVMRLKGLALSPEEWSGRLGDPRFQALKLGEAYYLRYNAPWVQQVVARGAKPVPERVNEDKWHPQDILYIMLYAQDQKRLLGIIGMEAPSDGLVPTEASIQPISLFATQAAAAIETTRLYLETLRQKETERRLTEMMESVSATLDMERVLRTLAEGLQQMTPFTRMHVALPNKQGTEFELRRVEITYDKQVYTFGDRPITLQGSAMAETYYRKTSQLYLLKYASDAGNFHDLKRWFEEGERATLMVPMVAGGEVLGVLRLGSELEEAYGFRENLDLIGRMANLSAVSIKHSRLLADLVASTSYNEAVVESIQQGIVVLDRDHRISTVNAFMQSRYRWSYAAVGKILYEYEPEFESFLRHSIQTALTEGTPQHQFEIQDKDKDGKLLIRNFYTYPLRQGDVVTGVVLLVEDVTERSLLEKRLAQRAEQLSALTRVSSEITSTLEPSQVVEVVLEALADVTPYDGVTLWLREGERLRVYAARGFKDPGTADPEDLIGLYVDIMSSALFREMSTQQRVLNVKDTTQNDPRFPYGAERVYKNWLGAPMIFQGEVVGVIALEKKQPNYYDANHEQLLLAFANQASVALRNAQLFAQTTTRARELDAQTRRLELLNRVAVALAQSLDIENILEITLRETALALEVPEASAIKIDNEADLARVVVEYPRGEEEPSITYPLTQDKAYSRLRDNLLPIVVEDFQNSPLTKNLKPHVRRSDVQSALFVPLVVGGSVIGLMRFDNPDEGYIFTQERIEIAQTLASQAAIAVQNASLFEQSVSRTHELETLFEASQSTAITLDFNEAMRRVVAQMVAALRADFCSIALWDELENRLEVAQVANAWASSEVDDSAGTVYDLAMYPAREEALRQGEVINLRLDRNPDPQEKLSMEKSGARNRLLVPLVVNEYSIGLITLEIRDQNRFFQPSDIRLARTLASQSAVAIENARLQTETRTQIEELYLINELSTAISGKVAVADLFPMLRTQLPLLVNLDVLYVALYDAENQQVSFLLAEEMGGQARSLPSVALGKDEFSYIITRKMPLLLWGGKLDEMRQSYGIESLAADAKCFLGVPMIAADEVVGVLAVQDNQNPRGFGLKDQRILSTVAAQLAVALQNARLFERTTQFAEVLEQRVIQRTTELDAERQRVQTLYDITKEVSASLDINRVLSGALERVCQAIGGTSAVILGVDELSEQLYVLSSYGGIPVRTDGERTQLSQDQGLAGWILKNRQGVIIPDVQQDPRWHVSGPRDQAQRSAVAALLEVGEDVRGIMMIFSQQVNAFNEEHRKLVTAAASQLANSMNNAELYTLIRDQAERLGAILRQEQVESTKNTAILDSIADGVMYANEHGTVVLFNKAAERILELPASRIVNRPLSEMASLYGGSSNLWVETVQKWRKDPLKSFRSATGENFVEEIIELENGRVVSVRLSPVGMGDQFLGTVSVMRDITKIVEVDRLKSEFVSTVSHELRTPMTSIKGYADLLLLGAAGEISEAQQRFLETIKNNADRLSILVNDLLEVSRIDQNRVPLRLTQVEIPELMESIAAHLRGRSEEQHRPMNIILKVPEDLPTLRADYDRMVQIVQNIADNAFNYTPANGTITLSAEHETETGTLLISVQDTGIGIPEEIQHRVFERFFRGDEYDDLVLDTPGTGLGLSIVKALVEMHQGKIWFESETQKGTTFYVRLPLNQESPTQSAG
jgi:PAS domain S-box-containing protein